MFDAELVDEILNQILIAARRVERRFAGITKAEDFFATDEGVDWKSAKGLRDILSHHYFGASASAIFKICRDDIPVLLATAERIKRDLNHGAAP